MVSRLSALWLAMWFAPFAGTWRRNTFGQNMLSFPRACMRFDHRKQDGQDHGLPWLLTCGGGKRPEQQEDAESGCQNYWKILNTGLPSGRRLLSCKGTSHYINRRGFRLTRWSHQGLPPLRRDPDLTWAKLPFRIRKVSWDGATECSVQCILSRCRWSNRSEHQLYEVQEPRKGKPPDSRIAGR